MSEPRLNELFTYIKCPIYMYSIQRTFREVGGDPVCSWGYCVFIEALSLFLSLSLSISLSLALSPSHDIQARSLNSSYLLWLASISHVLHHKSFCPFVRVSSHIQMKSLFKSNCPQSVENFYFIYQGAHFPSSRSGARIYYPSGYRQRW